MTTFATLAEYCNDIKAYHDTATDVLQLLEVSNVARAARDMSEDKLYDVVRFLDMLADSMEDTARGTAAEAQALLDIIAE